MKKNGFTLVELLAVIVLIGAIMTLAVIGVVNIINSNEDKVSESQKDEIEQAAINAFNTLDITISRGKCSNIIIASLQDYFEDVNKKCTFKSGVSYVSVCRNDQDELYVKNLDDVTCK